MLLLQMKKVRKPFQRHDQFGGHHQHNPFQHAQNQRNKGGFHGVRNMVFVFNVCIYLWLYMPSRSYIITEDTCTLYDLQNGKNRANGCNYIFFARSSYESMFNRMRKLCAPVPHFLESCYDSNSARMATSNIANQEAEFQLLSGKLPSLQICCHSSFLWNGSMGPRCNHSYVINWPTQMVPNLDTLVRILYC